jgi:N-acetylglucosaminyl-diphospho-decaprenol L-rhamnosyltransferase
VRIDIAIVSYRCPRLLRECLESLHDHPAEAELSVHVVDNASGDGSAEMVAAEFPEVAITANERNEGFAVATNQAMAQGSAPYVLALNPDCRLTAGALDRLVELMEARPEVGICGPALVRRDGTPDHAAARSFPTPLSALGHFTGVARRPRAPEALRGYAEAPSAAGPVDAVNGAFMLMRREMLDEIGAFDEGYWMYMEDLDLCYRAKQAGWVTWFEPSVRVVHVKGGSSGEVRSLRLNYAFHYGMARFYRRHYAGERSAAADAAVYAGIALKGALTAAGGAITRARRRAQP